jgi:rhodanese-related sulfurtransferase
MSNDQLIDIDVHTVRDWLHRGEAVLVDVREADEYAEERIPGTLPFPLSRFDPDRLPSEPGKKTVLTCFIGGRSSEAAERLIAAGHRQAFQLDGGLFAWKEAGFATEV